MVGRPSKKVFCQAKRKYDGKQCQAKGILCKNGRIRCRVHGGASTGPLSAKTKAISAQNIIKYNEQRASNNKANL